MIQTLEKEFTTALQWFAAIAEAVGKQKLAVVKTCMEQSPVAWELLLLYLNPYTVFHIGQKSMEADIKAEGSPYSSAKELIESLVETSGVTNKHIAKIKATLQAVNNDAVKSFIVRYLTKSITLGVTAESVNKAVGSSVIPTFNCMLAHKYFDHPDEIVGKTIAVTEKLDGVRAISIVLLWPDNIDVYIFSRQGKRIYGLLEVEKTIRELALAAQKKNSAMRSFVLDGELLITNRNNVPSKEQYKQTTKIIGSDKLLNKTGITYNVFDTLPLTEFNDGTSKDSYLERRKNLERLLEGVESPSVRIVPVLRTFFYAEKERAFRAVLRLAEEARAANQEGVMLNICNAKYVCKRTKNLLKVKVFQDCDVRIVGFQQGSGKYINTLGALLVDYKGNTVGVGSGLTDEQRDEIWSNQENYLGKIVTVQYFEETNDAFGNKSMRFPVFKELREEGKEVSYE